MFSVNQDGTRIVKEQIIPNAEKLNCKVMTMDNGTVLVDMGVHAPGSYTAGKLFVEATLGDLGYVTFGRFKEGRIDLPSIDVYVDKPREGALSAQFSGWTLKDFADDFDMVPIGSGPARAIPRDDICQAVDYKDVHHEATFAIQAPNLPNEKLANHVAEKCNIEPQNLYIIVASSGSLVGTIQVCSRSVEASMWAFVRKGFDINRVISGAGTCPIPPQTRDELVGMDRVNTALLYGTTAWYVVDWEDEKIEKHMKELPFSTTPIYGEHFFDLFKAGDYDFHKVDKDIHTIARYIITNVNSGKTFAGGEIREDMLHKSFF